jgi:hypothetical protein
VRFIQLACSAALSLTLAAGLTAVAAAPASAISARSSAVPLFDGIVHAIAYSGNTVYVGGSFTTAISAGRSHPRKRLAAFNARTGALLKWSPAADRTVRALAVSGSAVFAGGDFGEISGRHRDNLARLNGATGEVTSFSHTVTGAPYTLAVAHGRLYAGGLFSAVDGNRRGNAAAFSLTTGALDSRWRPRADNAVYAIASSGSRVYLGGAFHKVNDVSGSLRVAAVSVAAGAVDRGFLPKSPAQVNALAVDGAGVYAATGGRGGRAIAWTHRGGLRWQRAFDGDAAAIATMQGITYVGGHFDRACRTLANGPLGNCTGGGVIRVKIAAINSTGRVTSWAPQANGVIGVRTLVVDRSRNSIGAGGDFTVVNGQPRKRYASFS